MVDLLALLLILGGLFFYVTGTVGLLRLPDLFCRLHALSKADNVGLACIALGVMLIDGDLVHALKISLVWFLILAASGVSSHLIARSVLKRESQHE